MVWSLVPLPVWVAVWYVSSTVSAISLQSALRMMLDGESGQYLFAVGNGCLFVSASSLVLESVYDSKMTQTESKATDGPTYSAIPLLHFLSVLLMNTAMCINSIACIHTWRALEPAMACVIMSLAAVVWKQPTESVSTTTTTRNALQRGCGVAMMVIGVVLATSAESSCNDPVSVMLAMAINTSMLGRNYLSQKWQHGFHSMTVLMYKGSSLICLGFLAVLSLYYGRLPPGPNSHTVMLLVLSAISAVVYNHVSMSVCQEMELVSHSLLTLAKRPVIILGSCLWLTQIPPLLFLKGNALAIAGLVVYTSTARFQRAAVVVAAFIGFASVLPFGPDTSRRFFTIEFPEPNVQEPSCMLINMVESFHQHHPFDSLMLFTGHESVYKPLEDRYGHWLTVKKISLTSLEDGPLDMFSKNMVQMKWMSALEAQRVVCALPDDCTVNNNSVHAVPFLDRLTSVFALDIVFKLGGTFIHPRSIVQGNLLNVIPYDRLVLAPRSDSSMSLRLLSAPRSNQALSKLVRSFTDAFLFAEGHAEPWFFDATVDGVVVLSPSVAMEVDEDWITKSAGNNVGNDVYPVPPSQLIIFPSAIAPATVVTGSFLWNLTGQQPHCLSPGAGRSLMAQTSYYDTNNNGDIVQAIASMQYYPFIDQFYERDRLHTTSRLLFGTSSAPQTYWISNAWLMRTNKQGVFEWPPPSHFRPLFVSMHFAYEDAGSAHGREDYRSYYASHGSIGTRDIATSKMLQKHGIHAHFTGCLTLTLNRRVLGLDEWRPNGQIFIMRLKFEQRTIDRLIPSHVRDGAIYSNELHSNNFSADLVLAHQRLRAISQASLVITSLLHVALPCVALGIPVMFALPKKLLEQDGRVTGLLPLFQTIWTEEHKMWNYTYDKPVVQVNRSYHAQLVRGLHNTIRQHPVFGPWAEFYGALAHPVTATM